MTDTVNDTKSFTIALTSPCPSVTTSVTLVSKTNLTVTVDVQTTPSTGWMANDPHLDWGDDTGIRPVSNGHHMHTYPSAGRYNIQMGGGITCGHANSDSIYVDVTDPCAGITCNNTCDGTTLWSRKCVNGKCVKDALIKTNAPECGYVAPTPAHGQIESLDYPTSVNHGANVSVGFHVVNTGGQAGTFESRLYKGDTRVGDIRRAVIQPGGTSRPAPIVVPAPESGTSVTYILKLFRET